MKNRLDKIFSLRTLLVLNGAIILFGLSGGGDFLYRTGLIHMIAVFFILLSVSRIRFHYYTHDQFLEKFLHACMAAMLLFAFSHIVEFSSDVIFKLRPDAIYANVANFYILSLLLMALGAEKFLILATQGKKTVSKILKILIFIFVGLIFFFFVQAKSISLELDTALPYVYAVIIFLTGLVAYLKLLKIQDRVPFVKDVIHNLMNGIILIMFASFSNIFYEFGELIHAPDYFMINMSHYFFYFALTFMFLSFQALSHLTGLYKQAQEIESNNPNKIQKHL